LRMFTKAGVFVNIRSLVHSLACPFAPFAPFPTLVCAFWHVSPTSASSCERDTSITRGNWIIDANDMPFFSGLADLGGTVYCGATMISTRHLVTAAHCIKPHLAKALVGRRNQFTACALPSCFEGIIDAYIQHPFYSGSQTLRNDIALLRITTAAPESFSIALSPWKAVAEASSFVVAGMGATSEKGNYPSVLQIASVPAVPKALCVASPVGSYISDGMMCAGMLFPPPRPPPHSPPNSPQPEPEPEPEPHSTASPPPPAESPPPSSSQLPPAEPVDSPSPAPHPPHQLPSTPPLPAPPTHMQQSSSRESHGALTVGIAIGSVAAATGLMAAGFLVWKWRGWDSSKNLQKPYKTLPILHPFFTTP